MENMHLNEEIRLLDAHLALLQTGQEYQEEHELTGTPVFTKAVLDRSKGLFSQYGFLAGLSDVLDSSAFRNRGSGLLADDPRLFFNISAPSSAFICGSQGSGKSHTLSCLLENCLVNCDVNKLDNPLAGLIFHYDSFSSDIQGTPCEAAHLASNPNIKVRVLCSPANISTIKRTYSGMEVEVEALRINQSDLTTGKMLDLMAVSQNGGSMPLYLHTITRILRELRILQQENNRTFNYAEFKSQVMNNTDLTRDQRAPLNQRLDTLESFMPKTQTGTTEKKVKGISGATDPGGNDWKIEPGSLTIIDLSCPCVTAEGACALFNICLSIFLEKNTTTGKVIALDEAHKYMNATSDADSLTNNLLSSIRQQRHLGTRVFISTQEPTISPKLLDLCSITIVHRFTSPDWLKCLQAHLAALWNGQDTGANAKVMLNETFNEIVKLRTGQALLFAPSAIISVEKDEATSRIEMKKLGVNYMKVRIRARITSDGGRSVLAVGGPPAQPTGNGGGESSIAPLLSAITSSQAPSTLNDLGGLPIRSSAAGVSSHSTVNHLPHTSTHGGRRSRRLADANQTAATTTPSASSASSSSSLPTPTPTAQAANSKPKKARKLKSRPSTEIDADPNPRAKGSGKAKVETCNSNPAD